MQLVKVVIGGKEFLGHFTSPDMFEKCEKALEKALEKAKQIDGFETDSQAVRHQCEAICECADTILGEGSSKRLFPDGVDLLSCLDVYQELWEMKEKQIIPMINEKRIRYSSERARREGKPLD